MFFSVVAFFSGLGLGAISFMGSALLREEQGEALISVFTLLGLGSVFVAFRPRFWEKATRKWVRPMVAGYGASFVLLVAFIVTQLTLLLFKF